MPPSPPLPLAGSPRAVDCLASLCRGAECVALAGASRSWQAALGRGKAELWRRYLALPAYFACPILADEAVRGRLLAGLHPWNLRPVVRSLQGPGWSRRFVALRRSLELGRLRDALAAKPGRGREQLAQQPQPLGKAPGTPSGVLVRPAKRRASSLVGAAVREAKRRRQSIAARRDAAAAVDATSESALRQGLELLGGAVQRAEDCAQDLAGEVVLGILLPIRREPGAGDPASEAALARLRQAVDVLGRLRPTAGALRAARATAALGALGRSEALARLDRSGRLWRAIEELMQRWEGVLAEDILQGQWTVLAASRAKRPVPAARLSRPGRPAPAMRLSRPGPHPQRRRSRAPWARPPRHI
mmetsp:Transcript_103055/g.327612  ORF Transcript_103055/g.327612 Transcript_103055/m.327612 type:complete len:360 (+) Transcript_103055:115-1194(+)